MADVLCCEYEKHSNPDKGKREIVCTTDKSCPTRLGWNKKGQWHASDCDKCKPIAAKGVRVSLKKPRKTKLRKASKKR